MARRHNYEGSTPSEPCSSPVMTMSSTKAFLRERISFYPARITIEHHQLRHLITSPDSRYFYYVEGETLQRLDIRTRQLGPILKLPEGFLVSCINSTANHLILGAKDSGHFLSIKVTDICQLSNPEYVHGTTSLVPRFTPPPYQLGSFGTQIQNFCCLAQLSTPVGFADLVVAVIANNDCTVCIHSITHGNNLVVFNLPFPINHATFSPDGKYLIMVGDYERAYVIRNMAPTQRTNRRSKPIGTHKLVTSHYLWERLRDLVLYKHPTVGTEAYFTTAWSDDGAFLAVASESGYITLIDATALENLEADPILKTVPSSKPSLLGLGGPVRSMTFLPSPWDLLLWVEDSGKAYLGDLRDGLATRQVLDLDWKANVPESGVISLTPSEPRLAPNVDIVPMAIMQTPDPGDGLSEQEGQNGDSLTVTSQLHAILTEHFTLPRPADASAAPALPPSEIAHPSYDGTFQHESLFLRAAEDSIPRGPRQPQLQTESAATITTPRQNPVVALPPIPRPAITNSINLPPGPLPPPARSYPSIAGRPPITTPASSNLIIPPLGPLPPLARPNQVIVGRSPLTTPRTDLPDYLQMATPTPEELRAAEEFVNRRFGPRRVTSQGERPLEAAAFTTAQHRARYLPSQRARPLVAAPSPSQLPVARHVTGARQAPLQAAAPTPAQHLNAAHLPAERATPVMARAQTTSQQWFDAQALTILQNEADEAGLPDWLMRAATGQRLRDEVAPRTFPTGMLRSTGNVVSRDGGTIWIGTTEGIFEFKTDFRERRWWPSVDLQ